MKQMAHPLVGDLDWEFMRQTANVLLIRDPEQMLPSLVNQVPEPAMGDVGLDKQTRLLDYFIEMGQDPPVLDSREVLLDPESVLREGAPDHRVSRSALRPGDARLARRPQDRGRRVGQALVPQPAPLDRL